MVSLYISILQRPLEFLTLMLSKGEVLSTIMNNNDGGNKLELTMARSSPRCREKREKIKNLITPKSFIAHLSLWLRFEFLVYGMVHRIRYSSNVSPTKEQQLIYFCNGIFLYIVQNTCKGFFCCYFPTINALKYHTFVELYAQNNIVTTPQ